MKAGTRILAFLTVFVLVFSGYAATPAQALGAGDGTATFQLKKVDQANQPIQGVEFTVQKFDLGSFSWVDLGKMTTDANGNASMSFTINFVPTLYQVVEAVPEWYSGPSLQSYLLGTLADNKKVINLGNVVNTHQGKLKIVKHDANDTAKLLPGAKFDIYKGKIDKDHRVANNLTTNDEGWALSPLLPEGSDYIIVEDEAPSGYNKSPNKTGVTVDGGAVNTVDINDTPMGKIIIIKHDAKDTTKLLPGAKFDIYKGKIDKDHRVADNLTTDADGRAVSPLLADGTDYIIVEDTAPGGYNKCPNVTGVAVSSANETTVNINDTAMGKITIIKHDSKDTTKLLPGAKFDIYKGKIDKDNRVANDLVTDKDGRAVSPPLADGTDYIIVEDKAPTGYAAGPNVYNVAISDGGTTTVDINNTPQGQIKVIKRDSENHERLLKDAEFKIFNGLDLVATLKTGDNGEAISGLLDPGTYTMIESEAPRFYDKNHDYDGFGKSVTVPVGDINTIYVDDTRPRGTVHITKWIIDHDFKGYPGTRFEFKLKNTVTPEEYTGFCSGDGLCVIPNVPYGIYTLEETSGTAGFKFREFTNLLWEHIDTVTVDFPAEAVYCLNDRVGDILITKTDDKTNKPLAGAKYDIYRKVWDKDHHTCSWKLEADDVETGKDGTYRLKDQIYGEYKVVEVQAPKGYSSGASDQFGCIDAVGKTVPFTFVNTQLFGSVDVAKQVTRNEGDTLALPNFTVRITGPSDNPNVDSSTNDYPITPNDTTTISGLAYGTYSITELDQDGFSKTSLSPNTFVIDGAATAPVISVVNAKVYGSITVNKAFDGPAPADGAEFTFQLFHDSIQVGENQVLTWAAGGASVKFKNLEYGWTYYVKELPADNFIIDSAYEGDGKEVAISSKVPNPAITCTNAMYGKIEITKTDSFNGNPLKGAEFTVTPPEGKVFTLTTGANGKVTSDWCLPGDYTVQETKAPDGYAIDDAAAKTVKVGRGTTATVAFTDSKGSLVIIKRSSFGNQQALKGVVFQLLSADPGTGEPAAGTVLETKSTDPDGIVRFDRLNIGTAYWVREKQELPGYVKTLQARRVMPKVNPQLADYVSFLNNPQGTIRITKVDSADSTKKLAGAVFGIYTDAECTAANLVLTMTETNANGVAVSSPLRFGGGTSATYYVKEITAPADYVLNTAAQSVTFSEAGQEASLTFTNMRNKGMLVIKKVDKLTKAALPGATFALYTAKGGTQVGSAVTTGADGIAKFADLTPGTYYLVETVAPKSYTLPADGFEFKVEASDKEPAPIQIENQYNPPQDIQTGMMDWNVLLIGGLALVAGGLIVLLTRKRKTSTVK